MESESTKRFRDKWNNCQDSKYIEEKLFDKFNDRMENIISDKYLKIDKMINNGKSRKNK